MSGFLKGSLPGHKSSSVHLVMIIAEPESFPPGPPACRFCQHPGAPWNKESPTRSPAQNPGVHIIPKKQTRRNFLSQPRRRKRAPRAPPPPPVRMILGGSRRPDPPPPSGIIVGDAIAARSNARCWTIKGPRKNVRFRQWCAFVVPGGSRVPAAPTHAGPARSSP